MVETWIALAGGLASAGLGVAFARRLQRARPQLIPTSIRLSSDVIPDDSVVEPNSDLLALCAEHPYMPTPPFVGIGKVDERDYVDFLSSALETARSYVLVRLPAIARRAEQLQSKLGADDFEGVARIWAREWAELWTAVEGSYVRQEFQLSPERAPEGDQHDDDDEVETGTWYLGEDQDGTVYVMQRGAPFTVLLFQPEPRVGPPGKRSSELAKRLGRAFAFEEKPDLIRVFKFLSDIDRQIPALESLSQRIDAELRRLNRLSITALMSNTGGTPVSISASRCQMTMHLDGYSYGVEEEPESRPRVRRGDVQLTMTLVDDGGHRVPPLTVEAGGVRPIRAVHGAPLSGEKLPDGGTLQHLARSALAGSERTWQLELEVVLPGEPSARVRSNKIRFRELQEGDFDVTLRAREAGAAEVAQLRQQVQAKDTELSNVRSELSLARQMSDALVLQGNGAAVRSHQFAPSDEAILPQTAAIDRTGNDATSASPATDPEAP